MKTKHFIYAFLTSFIISNLLTTFWYMAMDTPNYVPFRREEMNYAALLVNHLIYAGLMVYFFPYYFAKHPTVASAFLYGLLIAALMFIPQALVVRSIWTVEINSIFFLNTMAHLIIGGVMGLSIYFITRKALT